jgi:hypothetical protein
MRGAVLSLILALAVAAPVGADKPDKSKGRGKGDKGGKAEKKQVVVVERGFSSRLRDDVRVYFVESHGRGKCPPGLAKKNNGCLPPGQAKKRYVVGRPIPAGVEILVLPPALEVRIGPAPDGYRYGIVDGDLVKLAVGTLLVVDAISGLVD